MARIFVSYRREDTAGYAGRLFDTLRKAFGPKNVFRDIEHIYPGQNFENAIGRAIQSSDVLIALIGRQWLKISDENGQRRIDDSRDFVHLEIATALKRNIKVIPVLVEDVSLPRIQDLPPALTQLVQHQAFHLSDERWDHDAARLVKAMGGGTNLHRVARVWRRVRIPVIAFAVFMLISLIAVLYATKGAVTDTEHFLALLAQGNVHEAYLFTASGFRQEVTEDTFARYINRTGLIDNASASWTSRSFENSLGELKGEIVTKQRGVIPLTVKLIKEDGRWRVLGLSAVNPIRETRS
jgi:hypothetical protein